MSKQIDLHLLDRRIEKLQQLRDILQDDETRELATQILSGTNGSKPIEAGTAEPVPIVAIRHRNAKKGELIRKVFETAKNQPRGFTVKMVLDSMTGSGFDFRAANPSIAVGGAVRKLAKQGKLHVAKEGSGSRGAIYETA